MKKSLAVSLIALPLLSTFSIAHADGLDAQEPVVLSAAEMDDVTAGAWGRFSAYQNSWRSYTASNNYSQLTQVNISPVTIVQIGNNNTAIVYSGNFAWINQ